MTRSPHGMERRGVRAWVVAWVLGATAPVLAAPQPEPQPERPPELVQPRQPEASPVPTEPEVVIDGKQPEREWSTGIEKPPAGPGRDAFDAQAISVDAILNEVK